MGFLQIGSTITCLAPYVATFVAFLILVEQIIYHKKKSTLPGPIFVAPFLGSAISLVRNPARFWDIQAEYAKSSPFGVSANYLIGKFMVFIRSSEMSHRVFANVRPDAFQLVGHPFGKKLFGEHNLIYMYGQEHKDVRRQIAPNFTPKALSIYTDIQQLVILKHLQMWDSLSAGTNTLALRLLAREMNLETSQNVFAGPYLSKEARERFKADYNYFNVGIMAFPIDLPGFAFRNARLAVERLGNTLAGCVGESKKRMLADEEPRCLVDFWMQDIVRQEREIETTTANGGVKLLSNREIGGLIFDFLFAAQDASTSSLLWAVALLDEHPEVLKRVREEVAEIWRPEENHLITAEMLVAMKYTQAVAREVVRYRAPATLVPHVAREDFQLSENYVVPKGCIVFPSVYESSFQGFTEPDRFDPDRFYSEERREAELYKRNFLVFGAGAHQCVGQRYALNLLVLFIAMFGSLMEFKRHRTDGCDEIKFCPTIVPKDDCVVSLSRRCERFPSLSLPVV